MSRWRTINQRGFTITELIIVISVIGILASIVLVVYPGYRQRTNDSERKSDVQQVAAALSTYALQKGNYVGTGSGCGLNGDGNGWLNAGSGLSGYTQSIASCLQGANILKAGDFIDPSGCLWGGQAGCNIDPAKAYMKATCTKGGNAITYVFAYLETQPAKDAEVDALCDSGSVAGFTSITQKWGTNYGMNYYIAAR